MATGLGGLLASGQRTKAQAFSGLLGAARMEAQQDIANRQIETQREAARQSLYGTALGVGVGFVL